MAEVEGCGLRIGDPSHRLDDVGVRTIVPRRRRASRTASGGRCARPLRTVTLTLVPLTEGAGDVAAAAVQAREFLHECEADAGALVGPRPNAFHAPEAFEEQRQVRVLDPDAGVGHGQPHVIAGIVERQRHAPVERELQCIRQEVEDDLLPHVGIDVHVVADRCAAHVVAQAAHGRTPNGTRSRDRRCIRRDRPASTTRASAPPRAGRSRAARSRASAGATGCGAPSAGPRRRARRRVTRVHPRSGRASASAACGTRGSRSRRRPSWRDRSSRGLRRDCARLHRRWRPQWPSTGSTRRARRTAGTPRRRRAGDSPRE